MSTVLDAYRRDQESAGLKRESVRQRTGQLGRFETFLAPRGLLDATRDDIETWLDRDPPLAAKTRAGYLSALSGFYGWAMLEELTERDPSARIRRPRLRRYLPRPMDRSDLDVALDCADARMRAWLSLGALQGLRCQEIAGLDRSDVQDHRTPPLLVIRAGKGDKERIVPLHPEALAALRDAGLPRSGPLFVKRNGRRVSPNVVSKYLNRYLHELGIGATAHTLRHKFGSDVYGVSRDLRLTQELLGHSSPATTAGYAAWNPSEAVGVIGRLTLVSTDVESRN